MPYLDPCTQPERYCPLMSFRNNLDEVPCMGTNCMWWEHCATFIRDDSKTVADSLVGLLKVLCRERV